MASAGTIRGLVEVADGYHDVEFGQPEEGGYLARVPALETSTFGKTLQEAETMVADMVSGWLEVAREEGLRLPQPKPLGRVRAGWPSECRDY